MNNQAVPTTLQIENGLWQKLPGIEEFCKVTSEQLFRVRVSGAKATVAAWNIIRACHEYANRPAVQAQVTALNLTEEGEQRRGRPNVGHRLVMEALAKNSPFKDRWLNRWNPRWVAMHSKLGLAIDCTEKEFQEVIAKHDDNLADWLDEITTTVPATTDKGDEDADDKLSGMMASALSLLTNRLMEMKVYASENSISFKKAKRSEWLRRKIDLLNKDLAMIGYTIVETKS